jgi:hypothetical protein
VFVRPARFAFVHVALGGILAAMRYDNNFRLQAVLRTTLQHRRFADELKGWSGMRGWKQLNRSIEQCSACPRLREHCASIAQAKRKAYRDWRYWGRPVPNFGDAPVGLLIVGLAPGAHGANRTGRMFTGDRSGEWLYFAAVTAQQMYRVRTRDLDDATLPASELESRVEAFAEKTMSDGLTTDIRGHVYITDPENSAILTLDPDGVLTTVLKTPELRWPDGFSFGPGGWLYVTTSALHHVIGRSEDHVRANAPYQIYRFRPGGRGIPGH